MSTTSKKHTDTIADNAIDELLDIESINRQLDETAADSPQGLIPSVSIKLLKDAVLTIDQGLKEIYQSGSDVNTTSPSIIA